MVAIHGAGLPPVRLRPPTKALINMYLRVRLVGGGGGLGALREAAVSS